MSKHLFKRNKQMEKGIDTEFHYDPENLQPLTSIDANGRYDDYIDTFKSIYNDPKYLNIAISGTYGSGKSSLIKVLKKQAFIGNHFSISLADFRNEGILKKDTTKSRLDMIEIKILRQLYYQSHFSYTRILRATNWQEIRVRDTLRIFAIFTVFILLSIVYFNLWGQLFDNNYPSTLLGLIIEYTNIAVTNPNSFQVIMIALFTVSGCTFIWYVARKYYLKIKFGIRADKINIQMESEKEDISAISEGKYLHELMYILKYNNVDTIFIEDLDRFDNTDILAGLKEINFLINSYNEKRTFIPFNRFRLMRKAGKSIFNSPIRFIFAIRDDVFSENDRLKFFDIIIPIIPIANSYNSYLRLTTALIKTYPNIMNVLDNSLVKNVCNQIWDMRMVNEIANEFVIFLTEKFKNIELSEINSSSLNQLFCLTVFKVKYPDEYKKLLQNRGIFYKRILVKNQRDDEALVKEDIKSQTKENKENAREINKLISIFLNGKFVDGSYLSYMTYSIIDTLELEDKAYYKTIINKQYKSILEKINYKIRNRRNFLDFIKSPRIHEIDLWNIDLMIQCYDDIENGYDSNVMNETLFKMMKNLLTDYPKLSEEIKESETDFNLFEFFTKNLDLPAEYLMDFFNDLSDTDQTTETYIEIFEFILNNKNSFPHGKEKQFVFKFFKSTSVDFIAKFSSTNKERLAKILSELWIHIYQGINKSNELYKKIFDITEDLGVKYKIIAINSCSEKQAIFLTYLIENSHFDLSYQNVKILLQWILGDSYNDRISLIANCNINLDNGNVIKLYNSLKKNFSTYFNLNSDEESIIDEDYIIWIFENYESDSDLVLDKVLQKSSILLSDKVFQSSIPYLRLFKFIENFKLPSNVDIYRKIYDKVPTDYLQYNRKAAECINKFGVEDFNQTTFKTIAPLLRINDINFNAYNKIVKNCTASKDKIILYDAVLEEDKLEVLIKHNLLSLDNDSLKLLETTQNRRLLVLFLLLSFDEITEVQEKKLYADKALLYTHELYDSLKYKKREVHFKLSNGEIEVKFK